MMPHVPRLASLALLLFSGCAQPARDEGVDAQESDVTVRPTDTGDLATVTFTLPASYRADVPELGARFEFKFNGTDIQPNVPAKVVAAKNDGNWGCLYIGLRSGSRTIGASHECIYQVAPRATRSFALSLVKLWWTNYPNAWATMVTSDASGQASFARLDGSNAWSQWDTSGAYALFGRNDIALPIAPGRYRYRIAGSPLPAFTFDVAPGVQVDQNAAYDDHLAYVDIGFPDREGYADRDAQSSTISLSCPGVTKRFAGGAGATEIPVSILVGRKDADTACTYTVNGFSGGLALRPTSTHAKLPLHRLNVDDVTLTDENGATIAGTYTVRRFDEASATWGAWSSSGTTRTGLDVPSGKYQVRVTYSPHGEQRQQSFDVTF